MASERLLATYVGLMGLFAVATGGFVACGAQTYKIPVDNDIAVHPKAPGLANAVNNGDGVHSARGWAGHLPISYRFSKAVDPAKRLQIQKAMHTWEQALDKVLFKYEGLDDRVGKDFASLYNPLDDMMNAHYFDDSWVASTQKPREVLATTIWENDPGNPAVIIKADIRYNVENYLLGDSLQEYSEGDLIIVDLESLALHELGHLLGLAHLTEDEDAFSVMLPTLFIGEGTTARTLSEGDVERIRKIYAPELLEQE